ncbi:MmgE/PrpD family protein [Marinomonas pollencensis]|uniref:2-methylcitrate dehydratase PrpD n=1 Tax=Marinomonas pollencensis TaxID=491954 RepID=A0A3E0DV05_9GAMM|nr:MmgE/PrpD family protein [Marinomonas pollencensis]REG86695.1 2-methylcitrate dehydratase PrpD [Marinomonas pollencensis]
MATNTPILNQAANFLANLEYEKLPVDVTESAKRAILDYIGVSIPGSQQPVAQNLFAWAEKRNWGKTATVIGRKIKMAPENAALINAASGHALDFDDTSWSTIGHPTTVIFPAILSLAEEYNCTGKQTLLAYIAGLEVAHKIADLMMPEASENGWHTTGIFYTLGTAAAACQLLQLAKEQSALCMALALSKSSGIRSNFGTQAKPYHAGMSAKAGLEAVSLTLSGINSSPTALEDEDGFIQCYASSELAKIVKNMAKPVLFGSPWDITHRGYAFKKYPNCSGNHPACDAILEWLNKNPTPIEDIASIHCGVSLLGPKELVCDQPKTPTEARFSIQFSLACALTYGKITLSEFTDEIILSPHIQELMSRITMGVDQDLARLGFIGTAPVKIWITKVSGEEIYLENNLAHGNPEKPFSDNEFNAKFLSCCHELITREQAELLLKDIYQLDKVKDIKKITNQLCF